MTKRIVYTHPDGRARVVSPAPEFMAKFATEAEGLAAVQAKSVPMAATDIAVIDAADISTDRTFRNAWVIAAGKPEVDMPKARVIHMDSIREERDTALTASDIEMTRALEDSNPAEIVRLKAKRTKLRDIPADFDLSGATTPDELKALWPTELPARSP